MMAIGLCVAAAGCRFGFDGQAGVDAQFDGPRASDAAAADGPGADAFVVTGRTWVAGTAPPMGRRLFPQMAYRPSTDRLYVYGGREAVSPAGEEVRGDLWEFDGTDWTEICDPCPPGTLTEHAMVWDTARDTLLLYGGQAVENGPATDNLWSWDGVNWAQVDGGDGRPPPLRSHGFAFDSSRNVAVLFGGLGRAAETAAVFEFDGAQWTEFPPQLGGPTTRAQFGMTYDPAAGATVLYGGFTTIERVDDAWRWNGSSWTLLCNDCTGTARSNAPLLYDPGLGETLMFAGFAGGGGGELSGTLAIRSTGSVVLNASTPEQRDTMAVAYDSTRHRVVVYGGNGGACSDPDYSENHCDDLLFYEPN